MKKDDIFEAIGSVDDKYLQESFNTEKRKRTAVKWICAAACICLAVLGGAIWQRGLRPNPTYETGSILPVYNVERVSENISLKPQKSGAKIQKNSTYDENAHYNCRDKNEVDFIEVPPEIDEPYFSEVRYDGGKFYACVIEGYDPDYTKSACGGWHFEDAVIKKWYFVDFESGKLSLEPEKTEPRGSSVYIYGEGLFKNVSWGSAEMEVKKGYFCKSGGGIQLCKYDENGKTSVIYEDKSYSVGSVETVSGKYVVFTASGVKDGGMRDDMCVFDTEEKKVVFSKQYLYDNGLTYRPLFIWEDKLYCDSFTDFNGEFTFLSIDIKTGKETVLQENVPFRNCSNMYISGGKAICAVSEGYNTEDRGGIYIFKNGKTFERIALPEGAYDWDIGPVIGDYAYFTVYQRDEKGTIYSYDLNSGYIKEVRSGEGIISVIYAGNLYCAYSKDEIICGKLG